jgi:MoxR-like ATPase
MTDTMPSATAVVPALLAVLHSMKLAFVGKDEVIDLLGLGLVAGENIFLHGPPGTAKSALVKALARQLEARSFDYLLTRFTEPNELFGPFDIRRLREGDLVTNTEGMLPEADLIFLDELLNANSAILTLLRYKFPLRKASFSGVMVRAKESPNQPTSLHSKPAAATLRHSK